MSLEPRQMLSHYRIVAKIGEGGMGTVYRALDTRLGREIALKTLPSELAAGPERIDRFRREARALAALNHPGIVTIFSVEEDRGIHFLTMELVEGKPLNELLGSGALVQTTLLDLGAQLADALAAAHDRGVIHRDLKPANVMLTREGRVKILDFGLAKLTRADSEESETELRTKAGTFLGTAPYMSPEQIESRPLDLRTDIFTLGIILHEMATGDRPFRARSMPALFSAILRDDPRPVTEDQPEIPSALADLISRCMQKQPADRFQSAAEVRDSLRRLSSGQKDELRLSAARTSTVVVLPFVNRSGDPDNEYFSDGLTEEVIADLSRVSAIRTISRNSAMTLKGATKDTPTLARELGVSHLVTGSVRRAGNALRVTTELVEAATDTPLWSEKYSGVVEDIFAIQEEIARKIVNALQVELTDSEEKKVAEHPIQNVLAYDCYLRARHEMLRWTPGGLQRALSQTDEALTIVGDNPLLLATKGHVFWTGVNVMLEAPDEGLARASEIVDRALALDPDLPLGLFVRGLVAGLRGQVEAALSNLYRARKLDRGDPNILAELCRFSNAAGLRHHGVLVDHLQRIDPLSHMTPLVVSTYKSVNGRLEDAALASRKAMERAPAPSMLHTLASWHIAEAGFHDEACEGLERVSRALAGTMMGSLAVFLRESLRGDEGAALAHAPPESGLIIDHLARMVADAYAVLGRDRDALRWVRRAIDSGFINYPCLAELDPFLGKLRQDEEFQQMMAELQPRWESIVELEERLG